MRYALEALRVDQGAVVVFQVAHRDDRILVGDICDGVVESGSGVAEVEQNLLTHQCCTDMS